MLSENDRVDLAVTALGKGDWAGLGRLLDASHASLRDLYDASTDAVERTVDRLRDAGAAGARMMGGGFGGSVLSLFAPEVDLPEGVRAAAPGGGAGTVDHREATTAQFAALPARTGRSKTTKSPARAKRTRRPRE